MLANWSHIGPAVIAAFLASIVEFVEALTVVLAVGSIRGWSGALTGSAAAGGVLLILVVVLGPTLTLIPLGLVQLAVGILLLLFGLRWLRKAVLRAAGVLALHDETAEFAAQTELMRASGATRKGLDKVAFAAAFKITMLEGIEVVFIVIAVGAGGAGLLWPASLAALAALALVILLGLAIHKPLAKVPENTLKFVVGVFLSAFGTFWLGEGMKVEWPGQDWSILGLIAGYLLAALLLVGICKSQRAERTA